MSSLHSYDRSLDKFMAWLSDAESALESLELELDSYGPGVKTSRERVLTQLKVGQRKLFDRFIIFLPELYSSRTCVSLVCVTPDVSTGQSSIRSKIDKLRRGRLGGHVGWLDDPPDGCRSIIVSLCRRLGTTVQLTFR